MMQTVCSVSGGKTSAYIAANYHSDHLIFALVRIEDVRCKFPDEKIRKQVEDRIQKPFIATAEEDTIIYTMLDLEQFLGKKINWVSGPTFDELVKKRGGWLPNKLHRYCTTHMKIEPMFYWWSDNVNDPVYMQIGFRANEKNRASSMIEKLNDNGLLEFNATFGRHENGSHKGKNKWELVGWQTPVFPLIDDNVYADTIHKFWKNKPVRFADHNNCVGCFHRNPVFLKKKQQDHPNKFNWFIEMEKMKPEKDKRATWRSDCTYEQIKKMKIQLELSYDGFNSCDSGYCGF